MKTFQAWLAATPLGTALKAFVAIVLTLAVSDFAAHGSIDFGAWQTWVIAGLVSAVPVIVNWLNPADGRYGKGSNAE